MEVQRDNSIKEEQGKDTSVKQEKRKNNLVHKMPLHPMVIRSLVALLLSLAVMSMWVLLETELSVKAPVVQLDCGPVEGQYDVPNEVFMFQGIPYAAPPTGRLRWRRPVPVYPHACWSGTLKPTTSNLCPQMMEGQLVGEEDCLKLNIMTPSNNTRTSLLPVVVTIHAGLLLAGSAKETGLYPDAKLTHTMNAVFVNFDYRLGPFGFLVAKELEEDQSGNYGIWDQLEALKWVKTNIDKFGGDPNKITLYGVSSGGTSAMVLATSPQAQGLLHQVWVTGAGAGPQPDARLEDAVESSSSPFYRYVADSGCMDAACLRALPMKKFFSNATYPHTLFPKMRTQLPLCLVIDGDLILGGYEDMWRGKAVKYSDVPMVIGTNAQETDYSWDENKEITEADLKQLLNKGLEEFGTNLSELALAAYNLSLLDDPEFVITSLTSDFYVTCGWNRQAQSAAEALSSAVYRYVVTYPPSSRFHDKPIVDAQYAFHGWDGYSIFCSLDKHQVSAPQQSDLDFQHRMRSLLKEFIHIGKISGWGTLPKATALIGNNITFLNSDYNKEQCEFWKTNGLLGFEWPE